MEPPVETAQLHTGMAALALGVPAEEKHAVHAFDPRREAHHVAELALNQTPTRPEGDLESAVAAVKAHAWAHNWGVVELVSIWNELEHVFDHEGGIDVPAQLAHVHKVIDMVTAGCD